ncbi:MULTISPECIES: FMN-binding protein [Microbacterium]|jgi:uncharacterized protein with FMN-binding domain|uniref:FMN-binding protein n=1 Tax=Microbacterium TaxID=33882 RepID=UPI0010F910D9|nr:hypothetical protein [Microbacterium sp. 4NA327F11]MCK9915034.1 hypothetical protein [Microbacteriaceae bacterium K1510]
MIRTTAVPRTVRTSAALLGIAGIAVLAGCSTTSTTSTTGSGSQSGTSGSSTSSGSTSSGSYKDGTFSATGSYQTPESVETIDVTVTLKTGVIESVEVTGNPQARESQQYQSQFIGGISAEVVGKSIDSISVSRVAGSSLTSGGFNKAIAEIKTEAAA